MTPTSLNSSALTYTEGDIDRKTLREIKRRFYLVNNNRLVRMLSGQTRHQQRFIEILPLLLHVNHPLLPGYSNKTVPAGITAYKPSRNALHHARCLSRSFRYNPRHHSYGDIYSVFLMGSTGTIAHSESSDLDIWVCHSSNLPDDQLSALQEKLTLISRWGQTLNLDVHFFLMNAEEFKSGKRQAVSTEDCGSSQHYLLLDEFYRTALLIAGRFPIWWLVPPEEEHQHPHISETLRNKRYISETESIDFGGMAYIPAGEFVGAGMWHLYKGVDAAYKSTLKICLTEAYASEFPNVAFLSLSYKKAIYNGCLDINELDPYILVYRKLEHYLLESNDLERLALIRRCFYFKVNIQLSKQTPQPHKSWRWALMMKLVQAWQWDERTLKRLDNRRKWNVQQVIQEKESLVNQLTRSYRFLAHFVSQQPIDKEDISINHHDMAILGRKLYAAFERKGGKLELVNPNISPNISEEHLTFHFKPASIDGNRQDYWAMYLGRISAQALQQPAIKKARSLIELLAWCYFNQLIDHFTRFQLFAEDSDLSKPELQQITQSFRELFPIKTYLKAPRKFEDDACIVKTVLYLNVGCDPLASVTRRGLSRLTTQTDPLRYSGLKDNLALTVDQVNINSWGEIFISSYRQDNAVLSCLFDYLKALSIQQAEPLPQFEVRCYCNTHNQSIAERIEQLFTDIISKHLLADTPGQIRYIVEIDRSFHLLTLHTNTPQLQCFDSPERLTHALAEPQINFSPIVIDHGAASLSILNIICQNIHADNLQIFYLPGEEKTDIYLADQMGALCYGQIYSCEEKTLISHLQRFIASTLYRQNTGSLSRQALKHAKNIEFYKLRQEEGSHRISLETKDNEELAWDEGYYKTQAIAELDEQNKVIFSIYCNNREFSQLDYGKSLFNAVTTYILAQRHNDQPLYPCYITDLDLTNIKKQPDRQSALSITQYFQFKFKLENALNQALFSHK